MNKFIYIKSDHSDETYKLIKNKYDHIFNYESDEIGQYYSNISDNNIITLAKSIKSITTILNSIKVQEHKILYITHELDINNILPMIQSNKLNSDNIIFLGLDKSNNTELILDQYEIKYFTIDYILKKGLNNILNLINNMFDNSITHTVFDTSVCNNEIIPNNNDNGLKNKDIGIIKSYLKNKIKYFTLTNFDDNMYKIKFIRDIMIEVMNIKEKKINIFTEDTRFVVYRPCQIEDKEDYGWYILRFLTLDEQEEILKNIDEDDIIQTTISYDDNEDIDVYISSTTIREQEKLSYYTSTSILDRCLFPQEKTHMTFELINK